MPSCAGLTTTSRTTCRAIFATLTALIVFGLAGCTTLQPSTPFPGAANRANVAKGDTAPCIEMVPGLPEQLPKQAIPFPDQAPYVLIPSDSAVGLLVPVPFVADMVTGAFAKSNAAEYQAGIGRVDPYRIAAEALAQQPQLTTGCKSTASGVAANIATLRVFVFVLEAHDQLYRLSLVFHLQQGEWVGRYYEHLPTAFSKESLQNTSSPATSGALSTPALDTLTHELKQGAQRLADLMARDIAGQLPAQGVKVDVGSLYLIGGNVAGLVAPEHLHFRNSELIEERGDDLVLRLRGDMRSPGQSGALLFGVHHFTKDQLHFFQRQEN